MTDEIRGYLLRQFDIAWMLTNYHLETLTTEECLWRPAPVGLHVHQLADGTWRADWPEREGYDIGASSIGWTTWHICFWWSMALNYSFGDGTLVREQIRWPGTAEGVRQELNRLQREWRTALGQLTDEDVQSTRLTRWPFQNRPFGDVIAWATVELTKNASEIGYARFLYAVRDE
jgi:hypothetical protein